MMGFGTVVLQKLLSQKLAVSFRKGVCCNCINTYVSIFIYIYIYGGCTPLKVNKTYQVSYCFQAEYFSMNLL